MSGANNITLMLGLNVTGSTLSTSASFLGEIRIIALPPDLQNLEEIQILEGKILEVKQSGQILISTEQGNVTISTNTPAHLQNKQEIELRIEAGTPPTKAMLRPLTNEAEKTEQIGRFDKQPIKTTLTQDAKTAKTTPLSRQQLLSGITIQMVPFSAEEIIAQPFMKQINSALNRLPIETLMPLSSNTIISENTDITQSITSAPAIKPEANATQRNTFPDISSLTAENTTTIAELPYHPLRATENSSYREITHFQARTEAITLPLESAHNVVALPFRAVAAQIIGTSDKTRILHTKSPVTSADIAPKSFSSSPRKSVTSVPDYTPTRHAEIKVRNIFLPQVQFTNSAPVEVQNTVYDINNLHFTPIPDRHDNNNTSLSSTALCSRIGLANAVVEGFTQTRGLPVLRMLTPEHNSNRLYALETPVRNLPMGSQLELEMTLLPTAEKQNSVTIEAADKSIPAINASHFLMPGNWTIMEEARQSLAQTSAHAAQAFSAALPSASTPAQLGASVLFFVAALRSGDLQSWLGEKAIDALKRSGKISQLGRLGDELSGLSRMNEKPVSGDWRALSIPLVWQNNIHKLVVYTNHRDTDTPNDNNKEKGRKTRFIVDLSLSHIGPIQLDGLFSGSLGENPGEATGRLDLVLRTEQSFSGAMKQQMRSAYKNAMDETNLTGELSFQDHTLDWVRITPSEMGEYSTNV